jgi:hypothetical protein
MNLIDVMKEELNPTDTKALNNLATFIVALECIFGEITDITEREKITQLHKQLYGEHQYMTIKSTPIQSEKRTLRKKWKVELSPEIIYDGDTSLSQSIYSELEKEITL